MTTPTPRPSHLLPYDVFTAIGRLETAIWDAPPHTAGREHVQAVVNIGALRDALAVQLQAWVCTERVQALTDAATDVFDTGLPADCARYLEDRAKNAGSGA